MKKYLLIAFLFASLIISSSAFAGDIVTITKTDNVNGSIVITLRNEYFPKIVSSVWEHYEALLKKSDIFDFDDLLLVPVNLLLVDRTLREKYQNRWSYIHIDEYQDTNHAQYMLSRILSEKHKNICVVGDSDQNIYSWRGANIKNILNFEKDYPRAKIIFLEENYRSTATIVEAAQNAIQKNTFRIDKKLFTKNSIGDKISFFSAGDESLEALFVASKSKELIETGTVPEHIAVLYRANFQSRILEETFLALEIPYQVVGTRFLERKEIRDIVSFLRAAENPQSLSDIKRIINTPPCGIGKITIAKLFSGKQKELAREMQKKISDFYAFLKKIKKYSEEKPPSDLVKFVLSESGLKDYLLASGEDGKERLENIKELVTIASMYNSFPPRDGLQKFLESVALATDQDSLKEGVPGVKLMTVHASKGLEFPYVFITGLEQGLFPHEYVEDGALSFGKLERAEEERRLFYVALTRAQKKLFLTAAERRTIFGKSQYGIPSEFLSDIPERLVTHEEFTNSSTDELPNIL